MAETEQTRAHEAARLEAALERIARHRPAAPVITAPQAGRTPVTAAVAGRLDTLIAELRAVLGRDSAD